MNIERDKEPYEKDYQAEWRKCVDILRRVYPMLVSAYSFHCLEGDVYEALEVEKIMSEIEDII